MTSLFGPFRQPVFPVLLKAVRSRPEPSGRRPDTVWTPPGAVRTLSVGLRRPEPYNDRHIKRENARESDCS